MFAVEPGWCSSLHALLSYVAVYLLLNGQLKILVILSASVELVQYLDIYSGLTDTCARVLNLTERYSFPS